MAGRMLVAKDPWMTGFRQEMWIKRLLYAAITQSELCMTEEEISCVIGVRKTRSGMRISGLERSFSRMTTVLCAPAGA